MVPMCNPHARDDEGEETSVLCLPYGCCPFFQPSALTLTSFLVICNQLLQSQCKLVYVEKVFFPAVLLGRSTTGLVYPHAHSSCYPICLAIGTDQQMGSASSA